MTILCVLLAITTAAMFVFAEVALYFKHDNARLRRGDFTPEEFQNLCHNLTFADRLSFERGCRDYQEKLFGCHNPNPSYTRKPNDV
jgi:hypothetical protein